MFVLVVCHTHTRTIGRACKSLWVLLYQTFEIMEKKMDTGWWLSLACLTIAVLRVTEDVYIYIYIYITKIETREQSVDRLLDKIVVQDGEKRKRCMKLFSFSLSFIWSASEP